MELKMLYKANNSGGLQQWRIWTEGATIHSEYGQVGGKLQTTSDTIKVGKNIGKANETTPEQQAEAEAQSKWEIQQSKKGYVPDIERARVGDDDRQGEECQLAHEYGTLLDGVFTAEQNHKIDFPAIAQPKLDGHRCRTRPDKTLWSRGQKPILSVPHIVAELQSLFPERAPKIDGELYNHELKEEFEKISSIVRQQKTVHPDHKLVQYHVYDVDEPGLGFAERERFLQTILGARLVLPEFIKIVPSRVVNNHEEVLAAFREFLAMGYEGAIIRNMDGDYEGKRSYNLQKLKEFNELEFKIVGVKEGRGKLQGHVGTFELVTKDGGEFEAALEGKQEKLKELWENPSLWQGKQLTVRFMGYTRKNKVPRHPKGIRIREDI